MNSEQILKLYCPACGYTWSAAGCKVDYPGGISVWEPVNQAHAVCARCGTGAHVVQPGGEMGTKIDWNELTRLCEPIMPLIRVRIYTAVDGSVSVDVRDASGSENERLTMHGFETAQQAAAYVRQLERDYRVDLRWG